MKLPGTLRVRAVMAILGALSGCRSGTDLEYADGVVEIRTTKLDYAPGDSLFVSIMNLSAKNVFYNLCPVFLEQEVQGGWLARGSPSDLFSQTGCEAIALSLLPGQGAELRRQVPPSVPAGTYRIRLTNYRIDGLPLRPEYHLSNTFMVQ
jgi:hypothetical protein